MNLGSELLRPGFSLKEKDGYYAEFYEDGQLAHFGYYQSGLLKSHGIYLEKGALRGRTEKVLRSSFPEDPAESLENLPAEEQAAVEESFSDWVTTWIDEIYRDGDFVQSCSFCQKTRSEVLTLIAGPTAYICNECVGLCNNILSD